MDSSGHSKDDSTCVSRHERVNQGMEEWIKALKSESKYYGTGINQWQGIDEFIKALMKI